MRFIERFDKLKSLFTYELKVELDDMSLEMRPFFFNQRMGDKEIKQIQQFIPPARFCSVPDDQVEENKRFAYQVFVPKGAERVDKAILLLHGLNERKWEKYLPWAEHLALSTNRAVILFPIAFHMNRTPASWYNPRILLPYVDSRKEKFAHNSTFANLALSSRLSENPIRFYVSGRESLFNLWQLIKEIKNGSHPLFMENTSVNIFAYSIGAFLSQVLLLADPERLTSDCRLFMFCGGSLFDRMNGNSRDIMDQESFHRLHNYFLNDFVDNKKIFPDEGEDFMTRSFKSMLSFSIYREHREAFFSEARNRNRIRAITLKKDTVIPTIGVEEAFGKVYAPDMLEEWDFPYEYSHQTPFPLHNRVSPEIVQQCFYNLFNKAAAFLR
ncbi:MAG: DUF6051 family protein [Dysgonamonadaceae bacterium]|jgi:hypothetical protein|nr:DUF6051 family protein [Dysgonamonadaceae bacterium]